MTDFKALIGKVAGGSPLSRDEARAAFDVMMSGEATPAQIGGFLMALRVRGETVDEIVGAVHTMRSKMLPVDAPADAIDIVGTGGDGSGSLNISTASAFVVAGAGVPVAKHGNRALSSRSGAADVLTALGVRIDIGPELIGRCVAEVGVGFMFAPSHHAAMRHVGPSRVELGTRTIFNLLGPLSNPARVKRQLVGVFARQWVEPVARVLAELGSEAVAVVHGSDGMDEMTTAGPTTLARYDGREIVLTEVTPESVGLPRHPVGAVKGGAAEDNAQALSALLQGAPGPYRDTVLLNAGMALVVAGTAGDLRHGVELASRSIDDGRAADCLDKLVTLSNSG